MKPDLKVLKREDAPKPPQDEKQSPAQSEMPFAVVDGEPVTTLPQDLYIPPYALQVFLEAFEFDERPLLTDLHVIEHIGLNRDIRRRPIGQTGNAVEVNFVVSFVIIKVADVIGCRQGFTFDADIVLAVVAGVADIIP